MILHTLGEYNKYYIERNRVIPVCLIVNYSSDIIVCNYSLRAFANEFRYNYESLFNNKLFVIEYIVRKYIDKHGLEERYKIDHDHRQIQMPAFENFRYLYLSDKTKKRYLNEELYMYSSHLPILESMDDVLNEIHRAIINSGDFIKDTFLYKRACKAGDLYRYIYSRLVEMETNNAVDYLTYSTAYEMLSNHKLLNSVSHIDNPQDKFMEFLYNDEKYEKVCMIAQMVGFDMAIECTKNE